MKGEIKPLSTLTEDAKQETQFSANSGLPNSSTKDMEPTTAISILAGSGHSIVFCHCRHFNCDNAIS